MPSLKWPEAPPRLKTEDVVGVQIANHGAVNQRGEPGGNFFSRANYRRIGAAALRNRVSECQHRRCVVRAESAREGVRQVSPRGCYDFRRNRIVAQTKSKFRHRLRQGF